MRLEIYDVGGRLVRSLVAGRQSIGLHSAAWDGTDADGDPVASGAYLYRFTAGQVRSSGRLMIIR